VRRSGLGIEEGAQLFGERHAKSITETHARV
jgi:hypothetical protein